MHGTVKAAIAAASAAVAIASSATGVDSAQAGRLQKALDDARRATGTPGVAAAIVHDGRVVWTGESGSSDRAGKVPITESTMFVLASVSKLFVATLAMRLVEKGELRLDGPIAAYVPSYLPDARQVTVRELLGHTSGYDDVEGDAPVLKLLADPDQTWTRDMLERREGPVRFTPGSRFDYCNSCYVMLGDVIEKAGGAPVGTLLRRYVLEPLRLQHDVDIDRTAAFSPRISHGFDLENKTLVDTFAGARDLGVPTYDWGPVWTDGGIAATASGVARFTDALFAARIVKSASLETMLAPGGKDEMLEKYSHDGRTWRGHSGFYDGFTAEAWHDQERDVTIVVLANRTDESDPATVVWDRLASSYDKAWPAVRTP
jgi:D-alanyl-D-alanine carboxypeptidase